MCDCAHSESCHGLPRIRYVRNCFTKDVLVSSAIEEPCEVEVVEPDDSANEVPQAEKTFNPEDWHTVDDTLRGRPHAHAERPSLPKGWTLLVSASHAAQVLLFWEIFSGTAGLTKAF